MQSRFNKATVSFLLAGLVIGFAAGYTYSSSNTKDSVKGDDIKADYIEVDPTALTGQNSSGQNNPSDYVLEASNQLAGSSVVVSSVSLPTKSWIAVADDSNGDIGYILGAQRLPAGVYQNVTVELLRDTVSEMPYHVVVFEDDGDDIFNHKSDILITLSDGSLLVSDFVAN